MSNPISLIIFGAIALIGGIFAIANPFAASLTSELIAAWTFIMSGIIGCFAAFKREGVGTKILEFIFSLLLVFAGIALLHNPLAGLMSLTAILASLLLFAGIAKVVMSFQLRNTPAANSFIAVLLSGIISIILAFMIFNNFFAASAVALGIMLGVELISSGISMIVLGFTRRKAEPETTEA